MAIARCRWIVWLLTLPLLSACTERIERHRMTWEYVASGDSRFLPLRRIDLHFVKEPQCWVWFHSSDLGAKLEALGKKEVDVDLRVRRTFGRRKSFDVVRIESIDQWDRARSGAARRGTGSCPPR